MQDAIYFHKELRIYVIHKIFYNLMIFLKNVRNVMRVLFRCGINNSTVINYLDSMILSKFSNLV